MSKKHRSRLDRQQRRLLKRCRQLFKDVNDYSDRICREREVQRDGESKKFYRQARRLIANITEELDR